jgi:hypothetical protein
MLSSTVGFAAAASYPAPFVNNGAADGAVVFGSWDAHTSDITAAIDLANDLSARITDTTESDSTIVGEGKQLSSGNNHIYIGDYLNDQVTSVTENDLTTILMDGTLTNDDGTDYDFNQIIDIGGSSGAQFTFSTSDDHLDNPAVHIEMPSTASESAYAYRWRFDFSSSPQMNASNMDGNELKIAGKTYTVSSASDTDTLILLGGADEQTVNVGESITMDLAGTSYEVSLAGISDESTPKASITVNGISETLTEGTTKEIIDGVDVYAKTVFRTGDNAGYVIVSLGSDRLIFEDGDEVQIGADSTDIDGTYVNISTRVGDMDSLKVHISADDDDFDHILAGESFTDPVFGTVKLELADVPNAPTLADNKGTDSSTRRQIVLKRKSNDNVQVEFEDENGKTATIPFADGTAITELEDDNDKDIVVVEGQTAAEGEFLILNQGNTNVMVKVDKIDTTDGDLKLESVFDSNNKYEILDSADLAAGSTDELLIGDQTFTVNFIGTEVRL